MNHLILSPNSRDVSPAATIRAIIAEFRALTSRGAYALTRGFLMINLAMPADAKLSWYSLTAHPGNQTAAGYPEPRLRFEKDG